MWSSGGRVSLYRDINNDNRMYILKAFKMLVREWLLVVLLAPVSALVLYSVLTVIFVA